MNGNPNEPLSSSEEEELRDVEAEADSHGINERMNPFADTTKDEQAIDATRTSIFSEEIGKYFKMALRLGPAKGKDTANTLGPVLVTPDELEPFRSGRAFDLRMTGRVNDELVSDGNWGTIDWGFPDMITYASRGTVLRPGDVIGSGTVETGCLFEHYCTDPEGFRGWLRPGDEVRLAVEQLGELIYAA